MRYHCVDEKVFESGDYEDLARQLWKSQFDPPPTLEEWMRQFADRAVIWNGATLRTDSPAHLIEDALATGIVERLPDPDGQAT